MIPREQELRWIYSKYDEIYQQLKDLEEKTIELGNVQQKVHMKLTNNRKAEKEVINKIEEELGRPLTQDDLLQMIRTNE
jgi:hypothetical protein